MFALTHFTIFQVVSVLKSTDLFLFIGLHPIVKARYSRVSYFPAKHVLESTAVQRSTWTRVESKPVVVELVHEGIFVAICQTWPNDNGGELYELILCESGDVYLEK